MLVQLRTGKAVVDHLFHANLFLGAEQASVDAAAHGIKQFEPVFQEWVFYQLPILATLELLEEQPLATVSAAGDFILYVAARLTSGGIVSHRRLCVEAGCDAMHHDMEMHTKAQAV